MPHVPVHPSAIKRHRRSLKRRVRNRAVKTHVHSALKGAQDVLSGGDPQAAAQALREAMKVLGKAATKGVIHRNTASRKISRLALRLNRVKAQSASAS
jgi:small subunit ribosomal protein S20